MAELTKTQVGQQPSFLLYRVSSKLLFVSILLPSFPCKRKYWKKFWRTCPFRDLDFLQGFPSCITKSAMDVNFDKSSAHNVPYCLSSYKRVLSFMMKKNCLLWMQKLILSAFNISKRTCLLSEQPPPHLPQPSLLALAHGWTIRDFVIVAKHSNQTN